MFDYVAWSVGGWESVSTFVKKEVTSFDFLLAILRIFCGCNPIFSAVTNFDNQLVGSIPVPIGELTSLMRTSLVCLFLGCLTMMFLTGRMTICDGDACRFDHLAWSLSFVLAISKNQLCVVTSEHWIVVKGVWTDILSLTRSLIHTQRKTFPNVQGGNNCEWNAPLYIGRRRWFLR